LATSAYLHICNLFITHKTPNSIHKLNPSPNTVATSADPHIRRSVFYFCNITQRNAMQCKDQGWKILQYFGKYRDILENIAIFSRFWKYQKYPDAFDIFDIHPLMCLNYILPSNHMLVYKWDTDTKQLHGKNYFFLLISASLRVKAATALLSARLSHRTSVHPSVCHTVKSVKNGAS